MESMELVNRKSERGFTLVELAIVMIIIGLLIGGILKGQELVANARVTATVAQVKGIDAATTTFQDKYDGMPGDLRGAGARLPPVCVNGSTACTQGDGDGHVDGSVPGPAPAGENVQFFQHLSAADLISDIQIASGAVNGGWYPDAKTGGAFNAAYSPGNVVLGNSLATAANTRGGHYLTLTSNAAAAVAADAVSPTQAFRIDNKLDDSAPGTGSVFGGGSATCGTAVAYNEDQEGNTCAMYIRFHQ